MAPAELEDWRLASVEIAVTVTLELALLMVMLTVPPLDVGVPWVQVPPEPTGALLSVVTHIRLLVALVKVTVIGMVTELVV